MELVKYNLQPQEQLAVSLYLKSMNKAQASRDAGYDSTHIFSKDNVKEAIAAQLTIRAERLRVGGDWVLSELVRVYERCMQMESVLDRDGTPTGEIAFDASNALRALALIGKHVDVKAFDQQVTINSTREELINRLHRGRFRVSSEAPNEIKQIPTNEVSFL